MIVKTNGMTYDVTDTRCHIEIAQTNATNGHGPQLLLAFVTCVDDSTSTLKQYFGVFDWACEEASIKRIMMQGGKWPRLPERASE